MMKKNKLMRFMLGNWLLFSSLASIAQTKVVAYVPNWINLDAFATKIDYSKITHINIAFENPDANGNLSFKSGDNAIITTAHANNVKVLVSIAGGAASEKPAVRELYFDLISNAKRAMFVSKITAYVKSHNFDGVDVDLEGPAINSDYGNFINDLSVSLKANGKLLTAALSQSYGGAKVPTAALPLFDWINIMAYDDTGPWEPSVPGQHSSMEYAKTNVQYWLNRGLPKSKAILGVPFYGYGFGSDFQDDEYSFATICATYPGAENKDQVGSIWYNGIPTIKAKTNYAFDQGIGGMMIWQLYSDATGSKSLLLAIDQVIKARSTNQSPTVNITSPVTNAIFTAPATISINAAASDADGSIAKVEFYNGSTKLGEDVSTPYSFSWSGVSAGTYSLTAKATDNKGASKSSALVSVVVKNQNQLPVVNISAPLNNASYPAPANISIAANASDADGSISKVEFFIGATKIGEDVSTPYSFSWTNVSAGNYNITARATDNAGGVATSAAVTVAVIASPVCVPVSASSDDGNVATNVFDNNFNTSWSAIGDGQWIKFCLNEPVSVTALQIAFYKGNERQYRFDIQLSSDGNSWSNILTNAKSNGTSLALETFAFASVQTTKHVRVLCHGNNVNTWNSMTEVKISTGIITNTPPTVNLTSPSNNASFTPPATIVINAAASDANGSVSKVEFYNGTTKLGEDLTLPYSFSWSVIAAGTYSITAKATDNAGASTISAPVIISVTIASDACASVPQYVENSGYVAGSVVKYNGVKYECKEFPYSGWCNGAAWAYGPGSGSYWSDAWYSRGSCSARIGGSAVNEEVDNRVSLFPNPANNILALDFVQVESSVDVQFVDAFGTLVKEVFTVIPGQSIDISMLSSGMYTLRIVGASAVYSRKLVKN